MISSTNVVQESWGAFKHQWFVIIVTLGVFGLAEHILLTLSEIGLLVQLAAYIVGLVLSVVFISVTLQFARKKKLTVNSAFKDVSMGTIVNTFLAAIVVGASILLTYITAAFTLIFALFAFVTPDTQNALLDKTGYSAQLGDIAIAVQSSVPIAGTSATVIYIIIMAVLLVAVFYSIALALRLILSFLSVVDKKHSASAALKHSWNLTRGHLWTIVALFLWTIVLTIAGFVALLVGLLVAIPVIYLLLPVLYNKLNMSSSMHNNM